MKLFDLVKYDNGTNGSGVGIIVGIDEESKFEKYLVMASGKMKCGHDGIRDGFIQSNNNNAWFYKKDLVKLNKEEI